MSDHTELCVSALDLNAPNDGDDDGSAPPVIATSSECDSGTNSDGPPQAHVAHSAEARRPLQVDVFNENRNLGVLPTRLHSDTRTLVLAILRDVNDR